MKTGRDGIKDLIAGLVAAVVLIGNIVSFGALMFPGNLNSGIPIVIWAMLISLGTCRRGPIPRVRRICTGCRGPEIDDVTSSGTI
jgi:hypothetical protein